MNGLLRQQVQKSTASEVDMTWPGEGRFTGPKKVFSTAQGAQAQAFVACIFLKAILQKMSTKKKDLPYLRGMSRCHLCLRMRRIGLARPPVGAPNISANVDQKHLGDSQSLRQTETGRKEAVLAKGSLDPHNLGSSHLQLAWHDLMYIRKKNNASFMHQQCRVIQPQEGGVQPSRQFHQLPYDSTRGFPIPNPYTNKFFHSSK